MRRGGYVGYCREVEAPNLTFRLSSWSKTWRCSWGICWEMKSYTIIWVLLPRKLRCPLKLMVRRWNLDMLVFGSVFHKQWNEDFGIKQPVFHGKYPAGSCSWLSWKRRVFFCLTPVEIPQAEECIYIYKWGSWEEFGVQTCFFGGIMILEEHVLFKKTDSWGCLIMYRKGVPLPKSVVCSGLSGENNWFLCVFLNCVVLSKEQLSNEWSVYIYTKWRANEQKLVPTRKWLNMIR